MKKIFLLVFVIVLSFSSCEKDDLCDGSASSTPRLIIEFYDAVNTTVLKNVTNLKVTGEGAANGLSLNFNGVSKIQLPLKTNDVLTKYSLILNSADTTIDNEDSLQFNYSHQDAFVSRACGFKTLFTLDETTPFLLSDATIPDGLWIQNIIIETPNIENENETHIKIYF